MKVFNRWKRPQNKPSEPQDLKRKAKQSMAAECDINNIMKKFQRTGMITHVARSEPSYGFATAMDYHSAMELVRKADEMFSSVPASIRKKFGNDAAAFLEFVTNPENVEEMRKLGVAKPEVVPRKDPLEVLGDRIVEAVSADRTVSS